jgi:hypothetical protein
MGVFSKVLNKSYKGGKKIGTNMYHGSKKLYSGAKKKHRNFKEKHPRME